MRLSKCFVVCVVLLLIMWSIGSLNAQSAPTLVECGQIVDGEFTQGGEEGDQKYIITLSPGDQLRVSAETLGDYLGLQVKVDAPTNREVADAYCFGQRDGFCYQDAPVAETNILSERGTYTVTVRSNGPGIYTIYFGCTLRDGTVISPGDVINSSASTPTSVPPETLSADTPGFPGLPPVDMSNAVKLPLIIGTPMTGIVTLTGNEVLGFYVEANAGDTIELSFRKLSGNLNLGVVVLSPDNRVGFYGGLVLSDSLSTRFTLHDAGQYTIGVYRVDLLPPTALEVTAFQVEGMIIS